MIPYLDTTTTFRCKIVAGALHRRPLGENYMGSKVIVAAGLLAALSACSIADHFQAESRMNKSGEAWRNCVAANLKDPSQCGPLKAIYDKDKADYEKT